MTAISFNRILLLFSSSVLVLSGGADAAAHQKITFPSADGLVITADLYLQNRNKEVPFVVLFHQAGWSRGEYLEIAPKLNKTAEKRGRK